VVGFSLSGLLPGEEPHQYGTHGLLLTFPTLAIGGKLPEDGATLEDTGSTTVEDIFGTPFSGSTWTNGAGGGLLLRL